MKRTETQRVNAWSKVNTKGFYLKLNKEKDSDIISWMDSQKNKQGYIKDLIRADILADHSMN